MSSRNLGYSSQVSVPIAATAAGTTEVDGAAIDLSAGRFQGVRFVAVLGTLTATQVTSLKAQGSLDGSTNWTDLAGTSTGPAADADSGKTLILDLYRPGFPFVRPVIVRGTANAAIQCVIADAYHAQIQPVGQATTNSATKVVAYPQAGTP
jgi:hypothetical protein